MSVEWLDNIANRSHIKRLRHALSEDKAGVIIFLELVYRLARHAHEVVMM